jgi:uncharacterized alkaline shock family protein YloU
MYMSSWDNGIKIREVAHNVMQKVAYVLENSAGLTVAQVNVNVKGVKVLGDKRGGTVS